MQLCAQGDDSLSPISKDEILEKFLGLAHRTRSARPLSANEQGLMRLAREVSRSAREQGFA